MRCIVWWQTRFYNGSYVGAALSLQGMALSLGEKIRMSQKATKATPTTERNVTVTAA